MPLADMEMIPESGVQTTAEPRSDADPVCPCGCGLPVAQRGGKPGKWAEDGCRQRYWNQTHHALELGGLSVVEAERAKRMADEAVKAVREGLKRATVDVLPVKHGRDDRPSCRVRLREEVYDDLDFLRIFFGDASRSATVARLVAVAMKRAATFLLDEEISNGQDPA